MEISPIQKVTINNFNAHLSNLRQELQNVSNELAEMLVVKQNVLNQISVFNSTRQELSNNIDVLNKTIKDKTSLISSIEEDFVAKEKEHNDKIDEWKVIINNKKKELLSTSQEHDVLKNKLIETEGLINQGQSECVRIENNIKKVIDYISSLNKQSVDIETRIANLVKINADLINENNNIVRKHKQELKDISEQVKNEKDIVLPKLKEVMEREKKVTQREKDIQIVIERYKKLYEKHGGGFII